MGRAPLRELVGDLSAGRRSSRDVVESALQRLDRVAELGGVASRDDDAVIAAADAADRVFAASGPIGPLHGVPVSVKDWIDATPFPCSAGWRANAERRPQRDASVVARLRTAGAIVIAKSSIGPSSELIGTPRNPLDPTRTPGYSSAGEAIMVATEAVPFGIGSDSGGSVRFPAHCCGLVGMRATFGRVPVTGHFPRVGPLGDARTVIGPLARNVDDLRLVLPLLSGPDRRDPSCPPVGPWAEPPVEGLRVAVHRAGLDGRPRDDVNAALESAAASLSAAGCDVVEADVLDVEQSLDITQRYWTRASLPGEAVEELLLDWDRSRVQAMRLLDQYDAILSPAAPYPAPLLDVTDDSHWTYMLSASLWGWPAIVVPAGWSDASRSDAGLPLGVQVMGGPWNEGICIALGEIIEM